MLEVIAEAVSGARSAGFKVVCLRSTSPKIFCSGADVGELNGGASSLDRLLRSLASLFSAMDQADSLLLTQLQGRALGAGGVVVGLSDIVLASEAASIRFPEIEMGLYPAFVHVALANRLHPTKLYQLCATGQPLLAADALQHGLVSEILPAGDFDRSAEDRLTFYVRNSDALLFGKRLRRPSHGEEIGERLARIMDEFKSHLHFS